MESKFNAKEVNWLLAPIYNFTGEQLKDNSVQLGFLSSNSVLFLPKFMIDHILIWM